MSTVPPAAATRWSFIDALRGFALAGIILVNVPDMTALGFAHVLDGTWRDGPGDVALEYAVQTRFVPIFELLFGLSLGFIATGARRRGRRPWLALLCRLGTLLVIGTLHGLIYHGEILGSYAMIGLVVLPVVLFAPRWLVLGLGAVVTVTSYLVFGGGITATPGLMLLGAAGHAFGLPQMLQRPGRGVGVVLALAVIAAGPALWWQSTQPGDPRFTNAGGVAGLVLAIGYSCALSLLLRSRLRRVLTAVFEPLGRMALSNYIGASLVAVPVGASLEFDRAESVLPAIVLALVIIAAQSVLSRLWLRLFRYGPLEWIWRMATWREYVPLRIRPRTRTLGIDRA